MSFSAPTSTHLNAPTSRFPFFLQKSQSPATHPSLSRNHKSTATPVAHDAVKRSRLLSIEAQSICFTPAPKRLEMAPNNKGKGKQAYRKKWDSTPEEDAAVKAFYAESPTSKDEKVQSPESTPGVYRSLLLTRNPDQRKCAVLPGCRPRKRRGQTGDKESAAQGQPGLGWLPLCHQSG